MGKLVLSTVCGAIFVGVPAAAEKLQLACELESSDKNANAEITALVDIESKSLELDEAPMQILHVEEDYLFAWLKPDNEWVLATAVISRKSGKLWLTLYGPPYDGDGERVFETNEYRCFRPLDF